MADSLDDQIVVTGFGAVSALGSTARETWNGLLSGQCGIRRSASLTADRTLCLRTAPAGDIRPTDLGMGRKDARFMRKSGLMLLKACRGAYVDARLDEKPAPAEQTGFFAGIGAVDARVSDLLPALQGSLDAEGMLSYEHFFADGYRAIHPLWPLSVLNNIAFCQTAIHLNLRGENAVFSPYNDAGAQAVIEGVRTLRHGHARAVVAAGASESATPFSLARAVNTGVFTVGDASPNAACLPYSDPEPATVLGEGAGALVLERRALAEKRGSRLHARITGYGNACIPNGEGSGPSVEAVRKCMDAALASAGRNFEDLDVLIAQGHGAVKDSREIEALSSFYGGSKKGPRYFSSKASLGNLLAGAPVVDAALAIFMILEGRVPHTFGAEIDESLLDLPVVRGCPMETRVKRVMIISCGPGGQAASLIMESCESG